VYCVLATDDHVTESILQCSDTVYYCQCHDFKVITEELIMLTL